MDDVVFTNLALLENLHSTDESKMYMLYKVNITVFALAKLADGLEVLWFWFLFHFGWTI